MALPQTAAKRPDYAIQVAVRGILADDAPLTALLGGAGRVVDGPSETAPKPYVVVGEHLSISDDDLTSYGAETTETLHVWTQSSSNKPGEDISARVHTLLHNQSAALSARLAAAGFRCVKIRNEFSQALKDPDPKLRHHVLRFRVVTAQLS